MRVGLLIEPSEYLIPNGLWKQRNNVGEMLSAYCVCTEYKFSQGRYKFGTGLKTSDKSCIPKTCENIDAD